jgi:hypothetical protein
LELDFLISQNKVCGFKLFFVETKGKTARGQRCAAAVSVLSGQMVEEAISKIENKFFRRKNVFAETICQENSPKKALVQN